MTLPFFMFIQRLVVSCRPPARRNGRNDLADTTRFCHCLNFNKKGETHENRIFRCKNHRR